MPELIHINSNADIPENYRQTPVGQLLEYHNLEKGFDSYGQPQLLIGTCMDFRIHLRIPPKFAFVVRTGGANMRICAFHLSFAIGVFGLSQIALIGHTQCGMSCLARNKEAFINGMVENAGWEKAQAEQHFDCFAPLMDIVDPVTFTSDEAQRLAVFYPGVEVVPMLYDVETHKISLIASG